VGRLDVLQSFFDERGEAPGPDADGKQLEFGPSFTPADTANWRRAKFLLDRGIDVAVRNEDGQTALPLGELGTAPGT